MFFDNFENFYNSCSIETWNKIEFYRPYLQCNTQSTVGLKDSSISDSLIFDSSISDYLIFR